MSIRLKLRFHNVDQPKSSVKKVVCAFSFVLPVAVSFFAHIRALCSRILADWRFQYNIKLFTMKNRAPGNFRCCFVYGEGEGEVAFSAPSAGIAEIEQT